MENKVKKVSKAREETTKRYVAKQWRPSVYIDKSLQDKIEQHFAQKGFKSFNEYVKALINEDIKGE